jgi:hypothetical protein
MADVVNERWRDPVSVCATRDPPPKTLARAGAIRRHSPQGGTMRTAASGAWVRMSVAILVSVAFHGAVPAAQQPLAAGRLVFTEPAPFDFNDHTGYVSLFDRDQPQGMGWQPTGASRTARSWRVHAREPQRQQLHHRIAIWSPGFHRRSKSRSKATAAHQ